MFSRRKGRSVFKRYTNLLKYFYTIPGRSRLQGAQVYIMRSPRSQRRWSRGMRQMKPVHHWGLTWKAQVRRIILQETDLWMKLTHRHGRLDLNASLKNVRFIYSNFSVSNPLLNIPVSKKYLPVYLGAALNESWFQKSWFIYSELYKSQGHA